MKVKYQLLCMIQSENLGKLTSLTSVHNTSHRLWRMSFKKTIFTFSCCVGWGVNAMA